MRIVEINTVNRGSTGAIMLGLANYARSKGHDVLVCYPNSRENQLHKAPDDYLIGNRYTRNIGKVLCKYFKADYYVHLIATIGLILRFRRFNPDIVHIHNLHDSFINIPLFLNYLKKSGKRIVWTMHDCWLYTGHCPHYVYYGCNKWQTKCSQCNYYHQYPESAFDDSEYRFRIKKKLLWGLSEQLTLVPVSNWLASEVSKSFLRQIHCVVVPNGIDTIVFKPSYDESIKTKYGIPSGKIYLAAATGWGDQKGLSDYIKLSQLLNPDEHLVLVGLPNSILSKLPSCIIGIERTDSKEDMAKLYTIADVVLSLSYAETFGLTIIEANACGTPAIVYKNTAQPELINKFNGLVAQNCSIESVRECLTEISTVSQKDISKLCIEHAQEYSNEKSYNAYLQLMSSLLK